jgi:hypothetical protein
MKRSSAQQLLDAFEAERQRKDSVQITFPWAERRGDDRPDGRSEWRKARSHRVMAYEDAVVEALVALSSIADDGRRTCRCLNAASCLCDGSNVVREFKARARSSVERVNAILNTHSDCPPANSMEVVDP